MFFNSVFFYIRLNFKRIALCEQSNKMCVVFNYEIIHPY